MPLLPFLPLTAGESLMSYVARMARFHAGMAAFPFMAFLDLARQSVLPAAPETVERIAALSGTPEAELLRAAIMPAGEKGYEHRGQLFETRFIDRRRITFCPACLLEDRQPEAGSRGERVGRLHWMFAPVRTCPRHGIPLFRRKAATEEERLQLPGGLAESDDALRRLVAEAPRRRVSPLQDYVTARLDGRAGPAWLDSQRIDQAARATQLLGATLIHGTMVKTSLLTDDQWDEAGEIGFGFTSRGNAGVLDGIEEISGTVKRQQSVSTPRSAYGPLYSAALSNPDGTGPITDILRNHILDTMSVATGETLLGKVVTQRRRHSITSLSGETGVPRHSLTTALIEFGLLAESEEKYSRINATFEAEASKNIAKKLIASIPASSIPGYLNCDATAAKMLVDDGYAIRIGGTSKHTGAKHLRAVDRVSTASLDAFLAKLLTGAMPSLPDDSQPIRLSNAARQLHWAIGRIVKLILSGKLTRVARAPGRTGFDSVLIDNYELIDILYSPRVSPRISKDEAAEILRIPPESVASLLRLANHDGTPLLKRVVPFVGNREAPWHIDLASFDRFRPAHVTLAALARQHSLAPDVLRRQLWKRDIRSILHGSNRDCGIYRLADL